MEQKTLIWYKKENIWGIVVGLSEEYVKKKNIKNKKKRYFLTSFLFFLISHESRMVGTTSLTMAPKVRGTGWA